MIDNTVLIRKFIEDKFVSDDIFFFVQIMTRKKDDSNNHNRIIQSYYIHSLEDFDNKISEIKEMCNMFHARAYFNPNSKSFKSCTLYMMKELTDLIIKEDYYHSKSLFNSVCGQHSVGDKLWLVDVDEKDINKLEEIKKDIASIHPMDDKNNMKIVMTVPTKHGFHLIVHPFNLASFRSMWPGIDVHKDNPTLLYFDD